MYNIYIYFSSFIYILLYNYVSILNFSVIELLSDSTPTIFLPISLRSGDKFRALRRYCFNTEEKQWVCDHIVSSCDDIESKIDCDIVLFCKRYQLNPSIVTSWINQYADGISFNVRVCPVDSVGINIIRGVLEIGD